MKIFLIFFCLFIGGEIANATIQVVADQDKPSRLYAKSYNLNSTGSLISNYSQNGENGENDNSFSQAEMNWRDGMAGTYASESYTITILPKASFNPPWPVPFYEGSPVFATVNSSTTLSWPPGLWPNATGTEVDMYMITNYDEWPGQQVVSYSITTNNNASVYPYVIQEFCDLGYNDDATFVLSGDTISYQSSGKRTADVIMHLQAGGRGLPKNKTMINLSGFAGVKTLASSVYVSGIPAQNVFIGSYGHWNANGSIYISLDNGEEVDVTPYVSGADYYGFSLNSSPVQTKADWQNVVQDEIDRESDVQIENYLASNGFMTNRANIQAVYAFYQKVFDEQPTWYYWAGLAKLAGAPVYAGLSDAQHAGLSTFQQTLIQMNIAIMNDLAWQFEAYRKGGLNALEYVYTTDNNNALNLDAINAWRSIDGGIQQNISGSVANGNETLLQREQQIVLAPGYSVLNSMAGISTVMSLFADSPVPAPQAYLYDYWSFNAVVGYTGNLCVFNDRWKWITDPDRGIWHNWLNLSNPLYVVGIPLIDRAADFSTFSLY